ncbi:hypothetical protein LAZ67_5003321 [Cordylochernes scorpioides]|uniref:Reverse transcriptase domain-containing protein n=1 Tax=Cordylochernes scorpioides TaxID=51811 RepID=A0ABY6KJ07_9ARAC|nr:hypothetical protein LAZ67_5003321 [Cordylochernes scorpioides]
MGSPLAVMGIDLESAFDSLDRGFLESLMTSLRLPPAFMGWINIFEARSRSRAPVIVAVYACGVDVEKGPIRQQLWNAPPCDNVESWFGAQSRMIPAMAAALQNIDIDPEQQLYPPKMVDIAAAVIEMHGDI